MRRYAQYAIVPAVCHILLAIPGMAQTVRTTPTFHNIGVEVEFSVPPVDTQISMFIRRTGTGDAYREIHPLSRISGTTFAGSAFQLEPDTTYTLKLASDAFASDRTVETTTRSDQFPAATNTTFHVAPGGDDENDGSSPGKAFRTLGKAISTAVAGEKILVHDGRYYEGGLSMPRSGTAAEPIVIENAPGKRAFYRLLRIQ